MVKDIERQSITVLLQKLKKKPNIFHDVNGCQDA